MLKNRHEQVDWAEGNYFSIMEKQNRIFSEFISRERKRLKMFYAVRNLNYLLHVVFEKIIRIEYKTAHKKISHELIVGKEAYLIE